MKSSKPIEQYYYRIHLVLHSYCICHDNHVGRFNINGEHTECNIRKHLFNIGRFLSAHIAIYRFCWVES